MTQKDPRQPFRGTHEHRVDAKGRIAFPADWRTEARMELVARVAEREGYPVLRVATEQEIERIIEEIRADTEPWMTPGLKRELIGDLNEKCVPTSVNSNNKLLMPKRLHEVMEFGEEVVLAGRGHEFEIIKPDTFEILRKAENADVTRAKQKYGI